MRVVIDMQGAQSGSRFRGIGRYSLSFAQAIVRNRGEHEIFLTLSALLPESIELIRYAFADILPQENIRVWSGVEPVAEINEANHKNRLQSELLREAFICSLNPDLIHICSLFEGYGDNAVTSVGLFDKNTPVSVTLYDLIPLLNPEQYLDNDVNYKKYYLNKVEHLKRCSVYLSISEFSKNEALDAKIITESATVFPVYGGVSDFFKVQVISDYEKEILNEKLSIKRPFVLFSGATDERKNIPRLLEAWSLLPQKMRNTYQIVLAGGLPNEHLEKFRTIAQKYGIQPYEICFTGYVTDDVFVKLYNMCTLYIFPSWHEGLGLPAMEAMACGAPVVGANTSSLPEVIGLDEALFDPFDVVAISLAIKKGIIDEDYRQRLREHGLEQIKKFTWDKTARMTFDAWKKVLEYGSKDDCLTRNQNNKRLLLELVNLDKKRLVELAGTIAKNQSMSLERQLFIDISCLYSELYSADEITIKLNFIKPIIGKHYNDYIPELVLLKEDNNYYYSRSVTKIINIELEDEADEPILWQRGDVFILLIADFSHLLNNINIYEYLEKNGVRVWIIRSNCFTHEYNSPINTIDQNEIDLFEFNKIRTRLISSQVDDKKIYSTDKQKLVSQSDESIKNNEVGLNYFISGALRTILNDMPRECNYLFVDISELVKKDARTGIQRVVRNILQEWLNGPPKGYQVMPVYATEENDYCHARRFTAKFLGHPDQFLIDEPIDYMTGDIFFILDLQPTVQISKRSYYEQLRQFGIRVYFLVHDLLCVRMPQYFGSGASENFSNWLDVVKENSGLICVSKATADDFINWVNETTKHTVNTVNVAWSHNGVELIEIREKHELSKEFCPIIESLRHVPSFLMVGTLEPRKGHMQVLDAFEKLWLDKIDVNLVIVGKQGWMMESFVERILAHPEIDRHLYWFGSINDEVLDVIYRKSACLIAASYGEGFGLPLVESAFHNLPIICRDISVFREIAQDNAFYFKDNLKPETVSNTVKTWLDLFKEDHHPKQNEIKWLTWSESASNMLDIMINKKWYTSFKPDGGLLLDKSYDHKTALLNFENGWSYVEEFHRWTEGCKSILSFSLQDYVNKFRDIIIGCHTLGSQRLILLINGEKVYEQILDSEQKEIVIKNLQLKKFNQLTFELPDAKISSHLDNRLLALAFKNLIVRDGNNLNLVNKKYIQNIALAFIVKDEGQLALQMIDSVLPVISFVSFIDTGSNDNTKKLIEDYLTSVTIPYVSATVQFTNFSDVRNLALQSLPQDMEYILVLDADETFDPEEIKKFDQFLNKNKCFDGFYLPRKNFIADGSLRNYPDLQLRLFKNKGFLYDGNVHEKANIPFCYQPSLEQLSSVPHINHYKYLKDQGSIAQRENLYRNLYKENTLKRKADLLVRLGIEIDPISLLSKEDCLVFDKPNIPSNNEYLRLLIIDTRPNIIFSVGSKNLSSLACMAEALLDSGHDGVILSFNKSCPSNFTQSFLTELVNLDIQDVVIPIVYSASKFKAIINNSNIRFDFIYLNEFTDFKSTKNLLKLWYPLLKTGGVLISEMPHNKELVHEYKRVYHAFFGDAVQKIDNFFVVNK